MNIVVTATSFCKREDLIAYTREQFPVAQLSFCDPAIPLAGARLMAALQHADAAIVGREQVDAALLDACPKLRVIAKYGVGTDNIDFGATEERGVDVLAAYGVNADAAAEHTLGLLLSVCRQITSNAARLRRGIWHKDGGVQLHGRTAAVVGCGHIGSRVARLLRAFGCEVILVDLLDKSDLAQEIGAKTMRYEDAIKVSQIVTFHVPLTNDTREMFGAEQLSTMPPDGIVINASRGHVVCEDALEQALRSGRLFGAGLDVYAEEPLTRASLYELENLVATPHTAGNAREAVWAMGRAAVDLLHQRLQPEQG